MSKDYDVDYNIVKTNIIKSCKQKHSDGIEFVINYDKLNRLSDDTGLTLLPIGMCSKRVIPENIICLSEYFKDKRLSWFNENKEFTQIIFIRTEAIDEKASTLISQLHEKKENDPDIDKVYNVAELVASYPCYFATVVAYESNDPVRFGKPTYLIGCRANTVTITQSNYKYNEKDI